MYQYRKRDILIQYFKMFFQVLNLQIQKHNDYVFQLRKESEEQMKQVLEQYEKTISELVADNKMEKTKLEVTYVQ